MAERLNDQEFDPEVLGGSIKRKIVNPLLVAEREKCNFNRQEAYEALYPADQRAEFKIFQDLVKKHPEIASQMEYYEMDRMEKMTEWWDRLKVIMSDREFRVILTEYYKKKSKYFHWFF